MILVVRFPRYGIDVFSTLSTAHVHVMLVQRGGDIKVTRHAINLPTVIFEGKNAVRGI